MEFPILDFCGKILLNCIIVTVLYSIAGTSSNAILHTLNCLASVKLYHELVNIVLDCLNNNVTIEFLSNRFSKFRRNSYIYILSYMFLVFDRLCYIWPEILNKLYKPLATKVVSYYLQFYTLPVQLNLIVLVNLRNINKVVILQCMSYVSVNLGDGNTFINQFIILASVNCIRRINCLG
jgi:hypothetical protein